MCNSLCLFCTQIQRRAEQVLRNTVPVMYGTRRSSSAQSPALSISRLFDDGSRLGFFRPGVQGITLASWAVGTHYPLLAMTHQARFVIQTALLAILVNRNFRESLPLTKVNIREQLCSALRLLARKYPGTVYLLVSIPLRSSAGAACGHRSEVNFRRDPHKASRFDCFNLIHARLARNFCYVNVSIAAVPHPFAVCHDVCTLCHVGHLTFS
jgi:hypothetical protein